MLFVGLVLHRVFLRIFEMQAMPPCSLQVQDVLRWRNPAVSALAFLLGGFCCLAGEYIISGNHTVTPLKGARQNL